MYNFAKQKGYTIIELMIVCMFGLGLFVFLPAWVWHVIYTIQNSEWILLVVGALFFPIGIVHGIGLWFGIF